MPRHNEPAGHHQEHHQHDDIKTRLDSLEKRQKKIQAAVTGCNKKLDLLLQRVVSNEEIEELTAKLKVSETELLSSVEESV